MLHRTGILAIAIFAAGNLWAQSGKAELFGAVTDPAELPVPGASVELVEAGTGAVRQMSTAVTGAYHFFGLAPGDYRLRVTADRFRAYQREGIGLRVGDHLPVDVSLQVGDVNQAIEVRAAAPLLNAQSGSAGFVTGNKKVETLPLDGRNFIPLIALSPGVSLPPGSSLPRVNGSRPRTSEYIYDGISVLQPEPGQVAYYPIIDAIEEFRVETNSYSAEYGRSNGGVILVNHKSGGNAFHGTLFEFLRNEKLNARNLFATSGPKPEFRRNQYGLVVGGPVQRDRMFFFFEWQGTRQATGVVRTSTVPSTAERHGIFSVPVYDPASTRRDGTGFTRDPFPGGAVPPDRFDEAAAAMLDRYPDSGISSAANNYRRQGTDRIAQDQFGLRLDRYIGARHRLFGRYTWIEDNSLPTAPLPDGSGNLTSGVIGATLTHAGSLAVEHTWTVLPTAVNQLRLGYTRRGFQRSSLRTGIPAAEAARIPGIPATAFADVLPSFDLAGLQQLGPPANANAEFTTSLTQVVDDFSTVVGRHSLKMGADLRHEHLDVLQPPSPTGLFQFNSILTSGLASDGTPLAGTGSSLASFLLGQVQDFQIDVQQERLSPRANIAEFFLQDDWRASDRLTLNLGVRYTLNFPSTEVRDRGAVFNLDTQQLEFLGKDGHPRSVRNLERTNFGPRIGLAWRAGNAVAVRAGYGLTWIEQAGITTPFTVPLFPFIQTIEQPSLDNIHPAFVLSQGPSVQVAPPNPESGLGQGVFAVQRDQGSGYAQQWNLTLQRTLGENFSIEVGYLGSKLTRLGVPDVNQNQLRAGQLALGPALTELVPNPFYGAIPVASPLGRSDIAYQQLLRPYPRFTTVTLYRNNTGNSTYHSFQARIEKRLSAGLTFTASYTFSKLIDDAGAVFNAAILTGPVAAYNAADSFNKRLEKDVSTGNIPHVFSSGFVYTLPFGGGLEVGGILRLQSGSPVPVAQVPNRNAFAGFGMQRPNRLRDPELPSQARTTARYFDTDAFSSAPQFTLGSSSRNPVTGPGYRSLDLMVGKTFPLAEQVSLEARLEGFNVTNTPPLGNPNGNFGTAAFGSITTAGDPRVFELALKLHY